MVRGMEWDAGTPGIPDGFFERSEGVPITKEEVRAIQISKARLKAGQTVYDVGCGSGSVTVEAAIQVGGGGTIVGIDRDKDAVALSQKNLERFGIKDATIMLGDAMDKIAGLGEADAILIGGTGGDTADIVRLCESKLKPGGRIVVGTILIETLHAVLSVLGGLQFTDVDIVQVTISKSRKTSTGTMMLARNPVTIISATRI